MLFGTCIPQNYSLFCSSQCIMSQTMDVHVLSKVVGVVNYIIQFNRRVHNNNFMLSMSRSLQDNFGGENSYKSSKFCPSYDITCQLALSGVKG